MGNKRYNVANHKNEFFASNTWIRDLLYEMMPDTVHTILDPCCGTGGLEDFSQDYDYTLLDIENRGLNHDVQITNFFEWNSDQKFDAVVCNPPFGQKDDFLKECFKYSDDVYFVAPMKSIMKKWASYIIDMVTDWKMSDTFGILVPVAIFHLHKNKFSFGAAGSTYESLKKKYFLPQSKNTYADVFVKTRELKDKPFIVQRMTMARVVRNEQLVKDSDIYEAGDKSALIAQSANANVQLGDTLSRFVVYFDTIEDAKKFKKLYDDNSDYVRNYVYQYGSCILQMNTIPLIDGASELVSFS